LTVVGFLCITTFMPKLSFNRIQKWQLYNFIYKQGKGEGHLRRVRRLHASMGIDAIEDLLEANQDIINQFKADGKAVPKDALVALKTTEEPKAFDIEEGDLDKLKARLDLARKEEEASVAKGLEPTELQDFRIWLPIFDQVDAVYKEIEANKAASKSAEAENKS